MSRKRIVLTTKMLAEHQVLVQQNKRCGDCEKRVAIASLHEVPGVGTVELLYCPVHGYTRKRLLNTNTYEQPEITIRRLRAHT